MRELQLKCISHKAILFGAHLVHRKIGIGFMRVIIKSPPSTDNLKKRMIGIAIIYILDIVRGGALNANVVKSNCSEILYYL